MSKSTTNQRSDKSEHDQPNHNRQAELLRLQNVRNFFLFRRDFVTSGLMNRNEALFIQDLINLASRPKTVTAEFPEEPGRIYFLCTVEYLEKSLCWEEKTQGNYLRKFKERNYIRTINKGSPQKRWVWIDLCRIEDELIELLGKARSGQKSGIDTEQNSGIDPAKNPGSIRPKIPGTNTEEDKSSSSKKKHRENTHAPPRPRACGPRVAGGGSVGPDLNGETPKGPSPDSSRLAQKLFDILDKNDLIKYEPRKGFRSRKVSLVQWAVDLDGLIEDRIRKAGSRSSAVREIEGTVDWYAEHAKDLYVPKVHTAGSFCERYIDIRNAMNRAVEKAKAKVKPKYSDEEEWVAYFSQQDQTRPQADSADDFRRDVLRVNPRPPEGAGPDFDDEEDE